MGNKYLYIPTNWQGFVQQLQFLVSRAGYRYFHVSHYPAQKKDKWLKIDNKLIDKYQTNLSAKQRSTNKSKGNANFMFLRFENIAVILMATSNFKGGKTKTREGIVIDDEFFDIASKDLNIEIGRMTGLKIHTADNKITVSMTKKMYQDKSGLLVEVAKEKNVKKAKYEFGKLNGLPAWGGINKQKFQLLKVLVEELKRHNLKVKESMFFVKLARDKVKVFGEVHEHP